MRHAYLDEYSNINSFIHQLDTRTKLISFITFILFVVFNPPDSFQSLALYAALIFILILLSKVPVRFILRRSMAVIPFVLVISMFLPFMKQGRIVTTYSIGILKLNITYEGLRIFWDVSIKAYLSALSMILLIATTGFSDLLKACEKLKFPSLIIMILSFMYRYIFLLQDELMQMEQAKESRSLGGLKWYHTKVSCSMLGVLFIRTYEQAEVVYLAMCARGFDGRIKTVTDFHLQKRDLAFFLLIVTLLTGIRFIYG